MRGRADWRVALGKAAIFVAGLLVAVAVMLALGAAEGTPGPQTPPPVAPRPVKWSPS